MLKLLTFTNPRQYFLKKIMKINTLETTIHFYPKIPQQLIGLLDGLHIAVWQASLNASMGSQLDSPHV